MRSGALPSVLFGGRLSTAVRQLCIGTGSDRVAVAGHTVGVLERFVRGGDSGSREGCQRDGVEVLEPWLVSGADDLVALYAVASGSPRSRRGQHGQGRPRGRPWPIMRPDHCRPVACATLATCRAATQRRSLAGHRDLSRG